MNVAIIGRTEILYDTALLLKEKGYNIVLIITAKEAPEYEKKVDDFYLLSKHFNCKFFNTSKITPQVIEEIRKEVGFIDIGVSINYPTIINQDFIDLFRLGVLNAHAGDLPRYRGNACIAWAILNGEEKVGICIHKMQGGKLDSGPIILKDYYPININTKITEVWQYFKVKVPLMFLESLEKLKNNPNFVLEYQDESKALRTYPLFPEDGRIIWSKSNIEILRMINAFNKPYSGAFCFYKENKMIIWDAEIFEDDEKYLAFPGQVSQLLDDQTIVVITGQGKIRIKEIEYGSYEGRPAKIIKSIRNRLF